ncbi:MAG: TetR/AcrR family transcriptional regulator [Dehalococcoidia bacterium]
MPKVTEEHLEARRKQILGAASACFSRKGFHQATIQDICQEAHLSPGAVYRYFGSKEEIIEAMAEESLRRNMAVIEAMKAQGSTAQVFDELAGFFFSMLDDLNKQADICLDIELWAEAVRNPQIKELLRHGMDSHRQPLSEIILRAQEQGEINPALDPDAVARAMLSLFDGLVLQEALNQDVDVWKYVAVVKALLTGDFWRGEREV